MGGINFTWLTVWVLSPDWLSHKLKVCDFYSSRLGKAAKPGGGVRFLPRLRILCPDNCLTTEEIMENLGQSNRKALG